MLMTIRHLVPRHAPLPSNAGLTTMRPTAERSVLVGFTEHCGGKLAGHSGATYPARCSVNDSYYVRPTQHLAAALGNYYSGSNASGRDHRVTQELRCPNRRSTVAPSLARSPSPHQRSDRSVRQSALPVGAGALRREG